jgi:catalase
MDVPSAMPRAIAKPPSPEVKKSPALSLTALPGVLGIRTRQIAILVADGVDSASIASVHAALVKEKAVVHYVGPRVGKFTATDGGAIEANKSLENSPSVVFDALVLPDGSKAVETLARLGHTMEYVKDQYRHCKTILALGASRKLLELAGIAVAPGKDPGILAFESSKASEAASQFVAAVAKHRHPSRDSDPPPI